MILTRKPRVVSPGLSAEPTPHQALPGPTLPAKSSPSLVDIPRMVYPRQVSGPLRNRTGTRERTGADEHAAAYEEARAALLLGQMVHDRRTELGLTQADLADRAGMTQPQLSRLESGGATPTVPLLARLAAALDADLDIAFRPRTPVTA